MDETSFAGILGDGEGGAVNACPTLKRQPFVRIELMQFTTAMMAGKSLPLKVAAYKTLLRLEGVE